MKYTMRDYQEEDIGKLREAMKRNKKILYRLPTGGGKTVTAGFMADSASKKGLEVLFLAHRQEIVDKARETFADMGIEHGAIDSGHIYNPHKKVHLGMVQTVSRRINKVGNPKFIMFDEAHHIAAKQWANIYNAFPDAYVLGLSATPIRLDGKGLDPYFDEMVHGKETAELIELGYLSQYKLFAPTSVNTDSLSTRGKDFKASDLEKLMEDSSIIGDIVSTYSRIAYGLKGICFASSINHSRKIVGAFNMSGIPAVHVDGEMSKGERKRAIRLYESGAYKIMSNVDLFGEGFDVPSTEVVIKARPTMSVSLNKQQDGRALRPVYAKGFDLSIKEGRLEAIKRGGKTHAIIIDHVGNCFKHGAPCEKFEYTLEGETKATRNARVNEVKMKACPQCFSHNYSDAKECKEDDCDYVFPTEAKAKKLNEVDGNIEEVDPKAVTRARKAEQGMAQSKEELIELAKARGYKNPYGWASHVMRGRRK